MKRRRGRTDFADTHDIYHRLAMEAKTDYMSARAGVTRLYREETDAADFMSAHPNDRIQFAQESGLFPKP